LRVWYFDIKYFLKCLSLENILKYFFKLFLFLTLVHQNN
jgi:hypothetical protein